MITSTNEKIQRRKSMGINNEISDSGGKSILFDLKNNINVNKERVLEILSKDKKTGFSYTPNSVAELMSKIGLLFNPSTILDPACGVGNIISYFDSGEKVTGYEIQRDYAGIAKLLNTKAEIICADFLKTESDDKYDLIISHFPMGRMNDKFNSYQNYELAFFDKGLSLLSETGVMVAIVPNSFLVGSQSSSLKEKVRTNYSLEMIINLPRDILPYTYIETSIIVIKNAVQRDHVFLTSYGSLNEIVDSYLKGKGEIWVPKASLKLRWDQHFYNPRFNFIEEKLKGRVYKFLSEIAEVTDGYRIKTNQKKMTGNFLVYSNKNIQDGKFIETENDNYIDYCNEQKFRDSILQEGDIVVNKIFNNRKVYIYKKDDPPAIVTHNFFIIRSKENEYIKKYLSSKSGQEFLKLQMDRKSGGATIPSISKQNFLRIKIPILNLDDLSIVSTEKIKKLNYSEIEVIVEALEQQRLENKRLHSLVEQFRKEVKDEFLSVKGYLEKINESLITLSNEIKGIKDTRRDEEEKLKLIYMKIDKKIDILKEDIRADLSDYEEILKDLIENYEKLDDLSKQFLPLAEYLYDKISGINNADFSPVILQYCRSIENEILKKIFIQFTISLSDSDKIDELIIAETENNQVRSLIKYLNKYKLTKDLNEIKYTLGDMHFILNLIAKGSKSVGKSPLLQELKAFISANYKEDLILEEFINNLEVIKDNRNRCAHPHNLNEDEAIDCKNQIPSNLDYLLNCINYKE